MHTNSCENFFCFFSDAFLSFILSQTTRFFSISQIKKQNLYKITTNSSNSISFSELFYLCDFSSFYYAKRHCQFQKACHTFLWKHLISHALEWECEKLVLTHVFKTFAKHYMLLPNLFSSLSIAWLKRLNIHDILSIKMKNWDLIYTEIYLNEMTWFELSNSFISFIIELAYDVPFFLKFGNSQLQK